MEPSCCNTLDIRHSYTGEEIFRKVHECGAAAALQAIWFRGERRLMSIAWREHFVGMVPESAVGAAADENLAPDDEAQLDRLRLIADSDPLQ